MNWPRMAEKLAADLPPARMHPAVRAWVADRSPRERWAVALSGGADSVALLLTLWAHHPTRRSRLLALHFDHRLRGRSSAGDARFCAGLCRSLGVALVVGRWQRPAPSAGAPSEAEARDARHAFFQAELRRRRVAVLFTGHHRDDVAETLLMRLARGSGTGGLCAPRPVHEQPALRRTLVRPLLGLDKARLSEALRTAGATWREDASNATDDHLRNRVRARLLPAWRLIAAEPGRDALAGLGLSRELLEEDDDALERWADRAADIDDGHRLALAPLRGADAPPRAVLRRVLHRWLAALPVRTDLNRAGFNALIAHLQHGRPGAKFSLGAAHFAVLRRGALVCENARTSRVR